MKRPASPGSGARGYRRPMELDDAIGKARQERDRRDEQLRRKEK
jgi:hypothetical protein